MRAPRGEAIVTSLNGNPANGSAGPGDRNDVIQRSPTNESAPKSEKDSIVDETFCYRSHLWCLRENASRSNNSNTIIRIFFLPSTEDLALSSSSSQNRRERPSPDVWTSAASRRHRSTSVNRDEEEEEESAPLAGVATSSTSLLKKKVEKK